jgi:hypothetical protein
MMKRLAAVLFFVALTASEALAADRTVEMTLTLDPPVTLPGMPVGFHIVFTNRSDQPVTIPGSLMLRVEPENGEPFFSRCGLESHACGYADGFDRRVNPGESRTLDLPVDYALAGPEFFYDTRLSRPGKYALRLIAEPNPPHGGNVTVVVDPEPPTEPRLVSSPVTFVVREPEGEDAKVWAYMQDLTGGKGWNTSSMTNLGFHLATWIWREHPDSYYLHLFGNLVALSDLEESARARQRALDLDPKGPQADRHRIAIAAVYTRLAENLAALTGDYARAVAAADEARRRLEELARSGRTERIREEARRGASSVPANEALAASAARWKARK